MVSEAQKKAKKEYEKRNTKNLNLRLNINTDSDILEHLETVEPSKMGYIKKLIRDDIKKEK